MKNIALAAAILACASQAHATMTSSQCEAIAKHLAAYDDLLNEIVFSDIVESKQPSVRAVGRTVLTAVQSGDLAELSELRNVIESQCN